MRVLLLSLVVIFILIPSIAVADPVDEGDINEQPVTFGGYVYRMKCTDRHYTNEDVIIGAKAYRTTLDAKPLDDKNDDEDQVVKAQIYLIEQVNGTEQPAELLTNTSLYLPGSSTRTGEYQDVNLGKLPAGTYLIKINYTFVDSVIRSTAQSVLISYPPVQYGLYIAADGRSVMVKPATNETLHVEVFLDKGRTNEQIVSEDINESKVYKIDPKGAYSLKVYVTDRYGYENELDDIRYHHYYKEEDIGIWIAVVVTIISVIISIIGWYVDRRNP